MRNESIGSYSWDNKNTNTGAEDNMGKNNWTDATIMKILNQGYESETGGSLYWNRKNDTCYSGNSGTDTTQKTKNCYMSNVGLKNEVTKNMISVGNYSLLGWNNNQIYSNQIYNYEILTGGVYNEATRDKVWTGKISLPYPSDYGYAVDFSKCRNDLQHYSDSTCTGNNWMFSSASQWLLTSNSSYSRSVWVVNSSGGVEYYYAYSENSIRPVLFLDSKLIIEFGDGSSSAPYQLSA